MDLSGGGFSSIAPAERWRAGARRRSGAARAADAGQQALLRALRVPPAPRGPRWQVSVVLAATIALHLAAALWLLRDIPPGLVGSAPAPVREVLRVELIEPAPPAPPAQALPAAPPTLPRLTVRAPPPRDPLAAAAEATPVAVPEEIPPAASSAARLFDDDGRVRLTRQAAAPVPEFRVGSLDSRAAPRAPHSPVTYRATRFEQHWVPADESALAAAVRKTTARVTVLPLPGGFKLRCVVSPLALGFGCGVGGPDQLEAPLQVVFVRDNLERATPLVRPEAPADTAAEPAAEGAGEDAAGPAAEPAPAEPGD